MSEDVAVARANKQATWSMVLGLSSLMCTCLTGIPAILLGVVAMGKVADTHRIRAILGITVGGIMTALVVVLAAVRPEASGPGLGAVGGGATSVGTSSGGTAPARPTLSMPEDQAAFCGLIDEAAQMYRSASNDLKKSAVRGQRKGALAEVLGRGRVTGWVGHVSQLTTNGDGKAVLTVDLPCDAAVSTWNNALSDVMDETLIPQSSELFSVLADLDEGGWGKKGSAVRFTGQFVGGRGPDGYGEMSLTELGAMTDPSFVFRFAAVEPL